MDKKYKFKFIDLFAGIGGFHIAMHNIGGQCVFASEKDIHARKTYEHNFKKISPELFEGENFNDDIRNIIPSEIPDFDILCAGFPCQPFSQAGYKRGFEDNHNSERGNLFFNIVDVIQAKRPKAFFLENVRGLVSHDKGNTFKVIRDILETELGYSFYYKIVKASDYGLPQLRPRVFIIGFRDESILKGFTFPDPKPLKYNMSDIWKGDCSREIGFTMRVGGRGSKIDDRRNWDAYLVDGVVRQLGVEEGKMLQGFPKSYEFPVSNTQAIKQLGNSVAIDAIQCVGEQMLQYLSTLNTASNHMKKTKNKGEWTELLVFVKLIANNQLNLSDSDLNLTGNSFKVKKVTTHNLESNYYITDKSQLLIKNKLSGETIKELLISDILNDEIIEGLKDAIVKGKNTFTISAFDSIQKSLDIENAKGGNSNQKADIVLDICDNNIEKEDEGFGIKSYLGSKPTLLNASGNTNFIFEVKGIDSSIINEQLLDEINNIDTRTKLKDRIQYIEEIGGRFEFIRAEKESMEYNLKLSDSLMPKLIGDVLLCFYRDRITKLSSIVDFLDNYYQTNGVSIFGDKTAIEIKVKKLLVDILLGFFAGEKWDGNFISNGTLVMKRDGEMVGFHIIDMPNLKNYLYNNIKLDTPSTTRHRFGKLFIENNDKLYFKLNLQLRF